MAKNLISVIDDDESIRRTTRFLVESFGFRVAAFESAEDFLRSGVLSETSCLIVDVQMPGMNGLQLQNELATAGCRIPIIFITAHEDEESRARAMQAGAVAFLGKPFNDGKLLQVIHSALQGQIEPTRDLVSVVDDDEAIRRTLTFLIGSFGFRAAAFESAESFLQSGELPNTSCLVLDVLMPGMSGLELQSELAVAHCSIPIIFITAFDNQESRGRAIQAGAVAFLRKPFSDEQLLQTIHSALRHDNSSTGSGG